MNTIYNNPQETASSTPDFDFLDVNHRIEINDEATSVGIARSQEIHSSFLDNLATKRADSVNAKMGDLHHVASIPVILVEKWKNEGFDIFDKNIKLQDIVKRLHSEDMQAFMATERRI
jgi:hypothetical protein